MIKKSIRLAMLGAFSALLLSTAAALAQPAATEQPPAQQTQTFSDAKVEKFASS